MSNDDEQAQPATPPVVEPIPAPEPSGDPGPLGTEMLIRSLDPQTIHTTESDPGRLGTASSAKAGGIPGED